MEKRRLRIAGFASIVCLSFLLLNGCNNPAIGDDPDANGPTLSLVSARSVTGTTATLSATSDEAGTMYYVVTTSPSTPTSAQVLAGADSTGASALASDSGSVSASTAKSFSVSGLSNFTNYYYYVAAADNDNNSSAVSSGSFSTIGDGCTARYTFENAITDYIGSHTLEAATGSASYSSSEKKEGLSSLYLNGSTKLSVTYTLSDAESIAAWVYLDASAGTYPTAVAVGGPGGVLFYYLGGNVLWGTMENGGVRASGGFTAGAWHHVVVTADQTAGTLVLYIDGVQCTDCDGSGDYEGETNNLYIGNDGSEGSFYWKGYIDDVQIYNRVLSSDEVADLYSTY